jgi:hypothetical protein
MASSAWPIIHAEREGLVADLESLSDEQTSRARACPP